MLTIRKKARESTSTPLATSQPSQTFPQRVEQEVQESYQSFDSSTYMYGGEKFKQWIRDYLVITVIGVGILCSQSFRIMNPINKYLPKKLLRKTEEQMTNMKRGKWRTFKEITIPELKQAQELVHNTLRNKFLPSARKALTATEGLKETKLQVLADLERLKELKKRQDVAGLGLIGVAGLTDPETGLPYAKNHAVYRQANFLVNMVKKLEDEHQTLLKEESIEKVEFSKLKILTIPSLIPTGPITSFMGIFAIFVGPNLFMSATKEAAIGAATVEVVEAVATVASAV